MSLAVSRIAEFFPAAPPNGYYDTKVELMITMVLYDVIIRSSEVIDKCNTFITIIYDLSSRTIITKHQRDNEGPVAINFLRIHGYFDFDMGD